MFRVWKQVIFIWLMTTFVFRKALFFLSCMVSFIDYSNSFTIGKLPTRVVALGPAVNWPNGTTVCIFYPPEGL